LPSLPLGIVLHFDYFDKDNLVEHSHVPRLEDAEISILQILLHEGSRMPYIFHL